MPELIDCNTLFELFGSGEKYKILRISDCNEHHGLLFFIMKEKEMKKIQEEKDNRDNVVDLSEARLALASKEPPEGGNWLSTLTQGTCFLAFKKGMNSSFLESFMVGTNPKEIPAVLLGYELNHRDGGFKWCDPVKFSREYGFYMIIKTDLNNDNSVQPGRVDSDEQPKVVDPVHETEQ